MSNQPGLVLIGRAEHLDFPELGLQQVPARIDTGAKTSALWATSIKEVDGELLYCLFGEDSTFYDGTVQSTRDFTRILVSTSTGQVEERYVVKHLVSLSGRKIRASFTLANRSNQAYPILVGRNVLRGKFLVDVKQGKPRPELEKQKEHYKRLAHEKAQQNQPDKQQEV